MSSREERVAALKDQADGYISDLRAKHSEIFVICVVHAAAVLAKVYAMREMGVSDDTLNDFITKSSMELAMVTTENKLDTKAVQAEADKMYDQLYGEAVGLLQERH